MTEPDIVTQQRLQAATDRRQRALAGALDALALARTNAARSAHGLESAAAGSSAAAAEAGPDHGGWSRRPDTTEIVVGDPDIDDPVPLRRTAPSTVVHGSGDDELEGRDWLR